MNAKNDRGKKRNDSFIDSKELFNKIFKEATQEIKLEKKGKKQSLPLVPAPPPGRWQHQTKMPAKEEGAAPPLEPAHRKSETTQAGLESKPKTAEFTLPPKGTPKPDKKGLKSSGAPRVAVLLILLAILAGTVSSYVGIIDISFLLNYLGSGRAQTTQAPVPKKQPVKTSEKGDLPLTRPQEQTPTPSSVPSGPSPSVPSKNYKLAELETPTTIAQAQADKAGVEENEPPMSKNEQSGPLDVAVKEPQTIADKTQPAAKAAAPEVAHLPPPPLQYPYSVYLGSFRSTKAVNKALIEYQEKGLSVYWTRVDLGDKGVWYRFFTGYFPTKEEAEKFVKDRNIQGASLGITRYANLVGIYFTDQDVDDQRNALLSAGFCPYAIKGPGGESYIYSGAFDRKEYAEKERTLLALKGIKTKTIER